MPSSDKARNVTLRVHLVPKLEQKWKKERGKSPYVNSELGGYINDLLEEVLQKDEFLSRYMPYLSEAGIHDNILFLKDRRKNKERMIEIILKDDVLFCDTDQSFDCLHLQFALAIPKVAKLNLRKPKSLAK